MRAILWSASPLPRIKVDAHVCDQSAPVINRAGAVEFDQRIPWAIRALLEPAVPIAVD